MPIAPQLMVYSPDGKAVSGPVALEGDLTGCLGEEFTHRVFTVSKDAFYALVHGVDFVRKHEPLIIVKQVDKMSPVLMSYLRDGTFLPKVEIRWFKYDEKTHGTFEYFRMTLEHTRLHSIMYHMPNVKDQQFERYGHLEQLQFVFQKITWLIPKGNVAYTDIWNEAFAELDQKSFGEKVVDAGEELIETVLEKPLTVKFTSGTFEEPKDGFAFDKKATAQFAYTASRKPNMKEGKVYAKLFAVYNGKTEDLSQVNEGTLSGESGTWKTEFKLKKPASYESDKARKPDAAVEFYAEIENKAAEGSFKGESCGVGAAGSTLQSMAWKSPAARRDEMVAFTAEFKGCKDGEMAKVTIFEYDQDGKHDITDTIQSKVTGGKLDGEWKFVYKEDTDDIVSDEEAKKTGGNYCPPEYFFTVDIGQNKWGDKQESGLLQFKDWIELELQDESGSVLANEPFELHLPDGSTQSGTLDEKGCARVEPVPPGPVEVVFKNYPSVTIKSK